MAAAIGAPVAIKRVVQEVLAALAESRGIKLVSDDRKLLRKMSPYPALAALAQPLADLEME